MQYDEMPCPVCGGPKKSRKNVTCSRACANTFFRRGARFGAEKNYRTICFMHHEKKCVVCGEDKIVDVHHYDHNHSNHDPTNLVPLCPTHHGYMHSRWKVLIEETVKSYHERMFESLPLNELTDYEMDVEWLHGLEDEEGMHPQEVLDEG